jgi:DNA polymerase
MHNFPRSKINAAQADKLLADFRNHDDPVGVAKSLVRSSICAPTGYKLIVTDYSSIENRVLAWIAGDEETLQKFRDGLDQYKDMAVDRYHVKYEDVTEDMRQMGKVIILGCGYGMGWETFVATAKKQFKMIVTKDDAKLAVKAYRDKYSLVKDLWKNLKEAAARCVITGEKVTCGLITFGIFRKNGIKWLAMVLPSGKAIYYMEPRIEYHHIPKFEEMGKVPTIVHLGLHPYSKKWTKLKLIPGRITENAVQGTAREIMGHGMLNVYKKMPEVSLIGTVHDEALGIIKDEWINENTQKRFDDLLCDVSWAKACPIAAKGFIDRRYRKD